MERNTVLSGKNTLITGDAPGIVADYVEQKLGAPLLYINGAAGKLMCNWMKRLWWDRKPRQLWRTWTKPSYAWQQSMPVKVKSCNYFSLGASPTTKRTQLSTFLQPLSTAN